jgi:hypothetical protein
VSVHFVSQRRSRVARVRWRQRVVCRQGRRREEAERIDVTIRVGVDPDPEVDERLRLGDLAARADRADDVTLADHGAPRDGVRPQVKKRHCIAVARVNRHRLSTGWNGACEADRPCSGRTHGGTGRPADVDSSVLTSCVGVATENE